MNAPLTNVARAAAETAAYAGPESDMDRLLQRSFTPRDLLDDGNFNKIRRMAEDLAESGLSIPKELKGNIGDCMAIVTQAMMWGLNPFAVAQKAHVINGKLGYEAQLVNAVVMQSGAIRGSFTYEYRGEAGILECRVGAVLRGESNMTWGEWLPTALVTTKNSPLWKTNPRQQMGYLQVKNWARAFAPGAVLGIYSTDELADGGFMPTGEVAAPPPPPALPAYDAAKFDAHIGDWMKIVAGGKKTPADILATISTKHTVNDEQRARILALKVAPAPKAPVEPPPAAPVVMTAEQEAFVAEMDAGAK